MNRITSTTVQQKALNLAKLGRVEESSMLEAISFELLALERRLAAIAMRADPRIEVAIVSAAL